MPALPNLKQQQMNITRHFLNTNIMKDTIGLLEALNETLLLALFVI